MISQPLTYSNVLDFFLLHIVIQFALQIGYYDFIVRLVDLGDPGPCFFGTNFQSIRTFEQFQSHGFFCLKMLLEANTLS